MRKHRTLNGSAFISVIFILSIILSSCATATPVIPGELPTPEEQSLVEVPGGLFGLPEGLGDDHPVVVFDFQIQSRLVTSGEFAECVEEGACEPGPEAIHEYAPAGVSWNQAQAYCSYLGGRLPTEAELTRATGGGEDCPETGGGLVSQEGFGEWVYDWDDPDYYNHSLVTNPFGPMYGDLKVAMSLDLTSINDVIWKYFGIYDNAETYGKGKYDEDDPSFAKYDDAMVFGKLDELKITFAKYDGQYVIKFENGKFFIGTGDGEFIKFEESNQDNFYPRMGILPDQVNPLVGFRCVTQGAALAYAPICKSETAVKCSPPAEQMETISAQLTMEASVNPNFQIVGANCPQDDTFDITISHELSTGEGVEINAGGKECGCQEYAEYPGKLYCDCPSPGAGVKTEVNVCSAGGETLIDMDDLCPSGSYFDIQSFKCVTDKFDPPALFSLVGDGDGSGASACPSGPGLPVPQYGPLAVAAASVEGVGESELPEGDQWELFSMSDGSGMCPPGYGYSAETSCCTPLVETNYDCGPDEYFDAGTKRCLPVGWDGCGPCQELNDMRVCVARNSQDLIGGRCNVGTEDVNPVSRDDYGRPPESSEGCQEGAYLDPGLGRCIETRDGCALGYYLDPKTKTCRPISGPESPCGEGYMFTSTTGCCAPGPGVEGVEYPLDAENIDAAFPDIIPFAKDGCPTTNYYDPDSDSCLLLMGGECPPGTGSNLFGLCIPDIPGECPDGRDFEPTSGSCPPNPPDPATCVGDKVFDASTGYCGDAPSGLGGRTGGDCDLGDLESVDTVDEDTPELQGACADASTLNFVIETVDSPDGILHCLMLTADKTFRSAQGFCRPQSEGDEESEKFFTVEFETGRVASITRISPDVLEPATATEPPNEDHLRTIGYVFGAAPGTGTEPGKDDWSDPLSGGLPGEDHLIPKLFVDAGSIFAPGNCTTITTTVPICAAPTPSPSPSSGGSSNKCTGLDYGWCGNTAGCGWNTGAAKCVVCSALTKDDCNIAGGCTYDGVTCKPN